MSASESGKTNNTRRLRFKKNANLKLFHYANAPALLNRETFDATVDNNNVEKYFVPSLSLQLANRNEPKRPAPLNKLMGAEARALIAKEKGIAPNYPGLSGFEPDKKYTIVNPNKVFPSGKGGPITSAEIGSGRYGLAPFRIPNGDPRLHFFDEIMQERRAKVSLLTDAELKAELEKNRIPPAKDRATLEELYLSMPFTSEEDENLIKYDEEVKESARRLENYPLLKQNSIRNPMAKIRESIERAEKNAAIALRQYETKKQRKARITGMTDQELRAELKLYRIPIEDYPLRDDIISILLSYPPPEANENNSREPSEVEENIKKLASVKGGKSRRRKHRKYKKTSKKTRWFRKIRVL